LLILDKNNAALGNNILIGKDIVSNKEREKKERAD